MVVESRASELGGDSRVYRLGAIYPDDVWVNRETAAMVAEFRCFLPPTVELVAAATPIPARDNTLELAVALAENGDIEEAARRLRRYEPACLAYYCTTISFARGKGGDIEIIDRIRRATGLEATTTSTAMARALRAMNLSHIAVVSPYLPDVERKLIEFLDAHSIKVVKSASLCLKQEHSLVAPERMCELVKSADTPEADGIFVACTGQKLAAHISRLEKTLQKPVLTANQVTSWDVLRLLGVPGHVKGRGRLLAAFGGRE